MKTTTEISKTLYYAKTLQTVDYALKCCLKSQNWLRNRKRPIQASKRHEEDFPLVIFICLGHFKASFSLRKFVLSLDFFLFHSKLQFPTCYPCIFIVCKNHGKQLFFEKWLIIIKTTYFQMDWHQPWISSLVWRYRNHNHHRGLWCGNPQCGPGQALEVSQIPRVIKKSPRLTAI